MARYERKREQSVQILYYYYYYIYRTRFYDFAGKFATENFHVRFYGRAWRHLARVQEIKPAAASVSGHRDLNLKVEIKFSIASERCSSEWSFKCYNLNLQLSNQSQSMQSILMCVCVCVCEIAVKRVDDLMKMLILRRVIIFGL